MIGELLQKLMLILSESITPLLQLSELLLTDSVIDRNLINLVSSSLSEISMSSNCCSNLLLDYCRMNVGNDAEIQTENNRTTARSNTTTTTTTTSTTEEPDLNLRNVMNEIVEHKNDVNESLSNEDSNKEVESEKKE